MKLTFSYYFLSISKQSVKLTEKISYIIIVRAIQKPKHSACLSPKSLFSKSSLSTTTYETGTTQSAVALSRRENHDHVCDLPHFCLPCTEAGALRDGEYCHPAFQSRASGKIERISLHCPSHPLPSRRFHPRATRRA